MTIEHISLNRLRVSPRNVRQDNATEIETLTASIQAHGLLQNLTVTPNCEGFEVVAGGRRLRALQALASNGHLEADHPVPCLVLDEAAAIEASTAENVVRLPMHPGDQYDAFQAMSDAGRSPTEIATRFGITEHHVRQMLRLAGVSPRILELYRADEIELAQVMALAIVQDHALQERTWKSVANCGWQAKPENIRNLLTPKEVPHDSKLGRFVGLNHYREAGGEVREDMFSDLRLMVDRALVERLAMEKLQVKADKLVKEGWSWVETRLEWGWEERNKSGYSERVDSWRTPTKAELEPLKSWCGCVIAVDESGKPKVHYGLSRKGAKPPKGDADGDPGAGKKVRDPAALSFAQTQALQGELSAILRDQLAQQPRLALAALAAALAGHHLHRWQRGVDGAMRIAREAVEKSKAGQAAAERLQALLDRLGAVKGSILEWLLEQPEEVTHEVLAVIGTSSINVVQFSATDPEIGPKFTTLAGVDVAKHWVLIDTHSGDGFLEKQPKGYIVNAVRECCGKAAADGIAGLKKYDATVKANGLLLDAQAKGKVWLPKPLRLAKPKKPARSRAKA